MLEVKNISKSYKRNVLKNLSFCVDNGEIVGIVGVNGSGKSTLVSIITGNIKSDSGDIIIDGKNINDKTFDISKYVGYVPQENVLFEKLTVRENIEFWCKAKKVEFKSKYFDENLLNEKVKNLSGGYKKILSIELALISNAKYLIMDEPTSALDLLNQQVVMDLIEDYKSNGNSVLFITHHVNEIVKCDKIVIIQEGLVTYFDEPNNILKDESDIINILSKVN